MTKGQPSRACEYKPEINEQIEESFQEQKYKSMMKSTRIFKQTNKKRLTYL